MTQVASKTVLRVGGLAGERAGLAWPASTSTCRAGLCIAKASVICSGKLPVVPLCVHASHRLCMDLRVPRRSSKKVSGEIPPEEASNHPARLASFWSMHRQRIVKVPRKGHPFYSFRARTRRIAFASAFARRVAVRWKQTWGLCRRATNCLARLVSSCAMHRQIVGNVPRGSTGFIASRARIAPPLHRPSCSAAQCSDANSVPSSLRSNERFRDGDAPPLHALPPPLGGVPAAHRD